MLKNLIDRFREIFHRVQGQTRWGVGLQYQDQYTGRSRQGMRGDVYFRLEHDDGRVEVWERHNVITRDMSLLIARLLFNPLEPRHGLYALAIGSGDVGWDLQNPPAETNTQRSLYSELARKTFSEVTYVDSGGTPVAYPTNVVDFTTTYAQSEAVGPLVEMGLLGGDVNEDLGVTNPITPANGPYDATVDVTGSDLLCNYLTFPVINKPATARLSITWRLTF
jgi:hypothetical protein